MNRIKSKNYGPNPYDFRGFKNEYLEALEYLGKSDWKCICKCGSTFKCKSSLIKKRKGCQKCTASIVSYNRKHEIPHYGYVNRLFKDYKLGAKRRKLDFNLTLNEFYKLIIGNCFYCGSEPILPKGGFENMIRTIEPLKKNGIDRVDSAKGYVSGNIVTCCANCNYAKHELSTEEFKSLVCKIYYHFCIGGSTTSPSDVH